MKQKALQLFGTLCAALATCLGPVHARDLPDLAITRVELRATGDCTGKAPLIVGKVSVKNVGLGRGEIFTTRVMMASSLVDNKEIRGSDRFVNSMRPGEVVLVDVRIGQGRQHKISGRHQVRLTVDPVNTFKEENERNNTRMFNVELNCP